MQKLAEVCIRRPVFAAMIVLALVVVGAASYQRLGVDRFPSVDLPTVSVRTTLPGASTEEVESEVSQILEEAINTVDGIEEMRSISSGGTSFVIVTFNLDRNIDNAAQDVRDRVSAAVRRLPRETQPPVVAKFNGDSDAILTVALTGNRPLRELTEIADKVVKLQLERSAGVGEVQIVGGLTRSMNIWIDPDRIAAYQIPISTIRDALVRQNADEPGGNVTGGGRELTLRTLGRLENEEEFNNLVVATVQGSPVRIRDLGRAEDGTKEQRSLSRLNGVPTVTLEVRRQSGANTVAVIEGLKAALARIEPQLPKDVEVKVIRDQSTYIYAALHEINLHLILGSLLASLVVLLFMKSWRSTVIAAVAIPASVISTFGMMKALNFTLNSVTMLALVLMVGVVIDDAIVVLENIFRFIEEKKMGPFEAAKKATADIGLAVLATTLSLVVIFVPVSFMSSVSGRFLYQFGITAAVAVMVSLLVSFTLTPMMSARLLRAEDAHAGHGGGDDAATDETAADETAADQTARSRRGFYAWIDRGYERMLIATMERRRLAAVVCLVVMAASIPLYKLVKLEYIPSNVDESQFEVNVTAPEGTSLGAMNDAMLQIEREIRATRGVQTVVASAGSGFLGGVNQGSAFVQIAPHEERTFSLGRFFSGLLRLDPLAAFRGNYGQGEVMSEVRRRLAQFKTLRPAVRNSRSFNIGGGSWDIDFVLRGPDLVSLAAYAERLRLRSKEIGGIIDADITLKLNKPELRVTVDRARAADLGVSVDDLATALSLMVGGDDQVSRFRDPLTAESYDVQIRLDEGTRNDPHTIDRLYVPGSKGLVRLDNLVRLSEEPTASRIDRLDRQRQVALRAGVAPGFALADRLDALQEEVTKMNLPAAYTTAVAGKAKELARTYKEFIWAFTLSIVFMYMILASQFESLVHPLTILLSLPLAVPFALISLWATGNTLNLYSALGVLVLFGVVKKNAILQIDHMNNLRAAGMERRAAILQGNRDRLRPILMTTLALVAGMLPLALGTGPGAEERRAIAVVVIGGQSLSLLLTLLATPVFYSIFDDLQGPVGAWVHNLLHPQPAAETTDGPIEAPHHFVIRAVYATRYVTPLREGGSLPAIVEADDLGLYVLKFKGAGQGPLALVAEWIGGEIGRVLGLHVPDLVAVEVDEALGRNEPDPEIRDLLKASVGVNLGLDYLPGSATFDPAVDRAEADLASAMVWFDAFVTNVDRTPRNPNLLWWHQVLYCIDHGAALYFHHDWESREAAAGSRFAAIRHHVLLPWASRLREADARLRPRLDADLFTRLVAAVPASWIPETAELSADAWRAGYVSFLTRRLAAAEGFVEEAVSARAALV